MWFWGSGYGAQLLRVPKGGAIAANILFTHTTFVTQLANGMERTSTRRVMAAAKCRKWISRDGATGTIATITGDGSGFSRIAHHDGGAVHGARQYDRHRCLSRAHRWQHAYGRSHRGGELAVWNAVNDEYVFWSNAAPGSVYRIAHADIGNVAATEIVPNQPDAGDLVIDDTHVFYAIDFGTEIRRATHNGNGVIPIATLQFNVDSLVVDDVFVYWPYYTTIGQAEIRRARKDGSGAVETIATGLNQPWNLAQDCTTVYWTDHDESVNKVAK